MCTIAVDIGCGDYGKVPNDLVCDWIASKICEGTVESIFPGLSIFGHAIVQWMCGIVSAIACAAAFAFLGLPSSLYWWPSGNVGESRWRHR